VEETAVVGYVAGEMLSTGAYPRGVGNAETQSGSVIAD
jgi:hypothetical protein